MSNVVSVIMFVVIVGAFSRFGVVTGTQVVGFFSILCAAYWMFRRTIPIGWEGRPPSFYLTGVPVIVAAMVMGAIGVLLLMYPLASACMMGWEKAGCP